MVITEQEHTDDHMATTRSSCLWPGHFRHHSAASNKGVRLSIHPSSTPPPLPPAEVEAHARPKQQANEEEEHTYALCLLCGIALRRGYSPGAH